MENGLRIAYVAGDIAPPTPAMTGAQKEDGSLRYSLGELANLKDSQGVDLLVRIVVRACVRACVWCWVIDGFLYRLCLTPPSPTLRNDNFTIHS